MARMIVADQEYVTKRYNLLKLKEVEELVAEAVQVWLNHYEVDSVTDQLNRSTSHLTIPLQVSA